MKMQFGQGLLVAALSTTSVMAQQAGNRVPQQPGDRLVPQNISFGANNWYTSQNVTRTSISFNTLTQTSIAANLFMPNSFVNGTRAPAIIVGHPMGATKEQAANLYATKLAEQGFVTVSLDLPFWGSSEGEPRNTVVPDDYAEAFSAAVDYLGIQSFIDRQRIGALGICGCGSIVISAAKIDSRIRAVATSAMYDMGTVFRRGLRNSTTPAMVAQMVAEASAQRWVEAEGGERTYMGGTPDFLTNDTDLIGREFFDFYRTTRGLFTPDTTTPLLTTHPTVASYVKFLNFFPFLEMNIISPRAMLFVTGDQSHSVEFSENAYAAAAEPKELVYIRGANHVDMYDRIDLIPFAKFTEFFTINLSAR